MFSLSKQSSSFCSILQLIHTLILWRWFFSLIFRCRSAVDTQECWSWMCLKLLPKSCRVCLFLRFKFSVSRGLLSHHRQIRKEREHQAIVGKLDCMDWLCKLTDLSWTEGDVAGIPTWGHGCQFPYLSFTAAYSSFAKSRWASLTIKFFL